MSIRLENAKIYFLVVPLIGASIHVAYMNLSTTYPHSKFNTAFICSGYGLILTIISFAMHAIGHSFKERNLPNWYYIDIFAQFFDLLAALFFIFSILKGIS